MPISLAIVAHRRGMEYRDDVLFWKSATILLHSVQSLDLQVQFAGKIALSQTTIERAETRSHAGGACWHANCMTSDKTRKPALAGKPGSD
jgi:hypothetical protein